MADRPRAPSPEGPAEGTPADFASLGLDARLHRAMCKMGFDQPTPVQARCIPLALEGKDVLARAPTGSGKTVAYAVPLLQRILQESREARGESASGVRALVLVPTSELCNQVHAVVTSLLSYARSGVRVAHVSGDEPLAAQAARLAPASLPQLLIATPARLLQLLRAGHLALTDGVFGALVVDEADLLLSYGYGDDLRQTTLMSATLTPELQEATALLLHNPVTVDMGAPEPGAGGAAAGGATPGSSSPDLSQYWLSCPSRDKYLVMFALLKLNRIPGRALVFCNEVSRSFRLKLFLEQFGVHCGVLNAELPLNSRWHMIQAFNKGTFDLLIATDDPRLGQQSGAAAAAGGVPGSAEAGAPPEGGQGGGPKAKRGRQKGKGAKGSAAAQQQPGAHASAEFGVSRGVDFQGVTAVINFDLPETIAMYQHRVGRTARAGLAGTAISFAASEEPAQAEQIRALRELYGEDALRPLNVEFSKLNSFRYRVEDAIRSVTRAAVQEARLREIRSELLNSAALQAHFEDHPDDLHVLRHDRPLTTVRAAPELKSIPRYLLPDRRQAVDRQLGAQLARVARSAKRRMPAQAKRAGSKHKLGGGRKRKHDPLVALGARGRKAGTAGGGPKRARR